jgi:hypothetical protein
VAIAAYLAYRLDKMGFDSKYITSDIEAGVVTVYNVKTNRVVKRKDPEDFGPSYYIDLGQNNEYKMSRPEIGLRKNVNLFRTKK